MLRYLSSPFRFVVRHRRAVIRCVLLGLHVFLRLKSQGRCTPTATHRRNDGQLSLNFERDDTQG